MSNKHSRMMNGAETLGGDKLATYNSNAVLNGLASAGTSESAQTANVETYRSAVSAGSETRAER
jgi:hypothetical protein